MLAVDAPAGRVGAALTIVPYTPEFIPAVRSFNVRLAAAGVPYQFPESHLSPWLPALAGRSVREEYFVAADATETVRGGYILKHQRFEVGGASVPVGFYHLPLSEGLIDSRYALLGMQLLADALRRQRDLFVLGIGSFSEPLARMLLRLGWPLRTVPLYFHMLRPFRVARQLRHLRGTLGRRLLLDVAAFTGVASIGSRCLQWQRFRGQRCSAASLVDEFGPWADELWERTRPTLTFAAVRDAATLNLLYRGDFRPFLRVQVTLDRRVVGWAVVLNTPMQDHRYFGNLRIGSIVDCLADPGCERHVAVQATRVLGDLGADLIVSNQSARSWGEALRHAGFLPGPSGFLFGASRALARRLGPLERAFGQMHLTRGDGDGPINL